jgi:glycosyltransferase involved in cell wall biosynthesis
MSQPPTEAGALWVVIPAYNEGTTVRDVAIRVLRHCPHVIVVDDGSTDETVDALAGLDVMLLRNTQNRGKADSLWRGFQEALAHGAAAVITLDADGQHAPDDIPSLIAVALRAPEAFIIGARRVEERISSSRCRYVANRVADFWISWAAGRPIEDSQSGFRLYPAPFLRTLTLKHGLKEGFVFESEVLIEAARNRVPCLHVPITVRPRMGARASHFRPVVDIVRITEMVAWKILQRGLYLRGLVVSIRASPTNLLKATSDDVGHQTQHRTLL